MARADHREVTRGLVTSQGYVRRVQHAPRSAGPLGPEQVVWCRDEATGLRAVIAVHSTVLGPSCGGTRFRPYASEDEALTDVLRLAEGMTYKHAACGNDLGGGKAVIIGDPRTDRTEALMKRYAAFIHSLDGAYLTAEDVGTTQADMDLIRTVTPYATGYTGGSGDPSPATAWGVLHAMYAVADAVWGSESLAGRHVVVSGIGKVGRALAGHLLDVGARVTVADPVATMDGVEVVDPAVAHTVECDVFSPNAYGAVLSATTIPELRCAAVCGAANNQLATHDDAVRLAERGVLYAPDYVANAGGVINIADELHGTYDHDRAFARVAGIRETMANVLRTASAEGMTTADAADRLAERRIDAARA
jgi:glutamate dehydrogenase/leucine dehydrogenase